MIPHVLSNFKLYGDGNDLLGIVDLDLPELKSLTGDLTGAGIAGKLDLPIQGQFESLEIKVNWRTITADMLHVGADGYVHLDARGAISMQDQENNKFSIMPVKVVAKGVAKSLNLGSMKVAESMGASTTLEAVYLKIEVAGKTEVEIDKFNCIANINGNDVLQGVRDALGM